MNPSVSATSFHIRLIVEYSLFRVVGRGSFLPCLSTALVTDQLESCRCDALVGSVADPPVLFLQEPSHHLPQGQDFDRFSSVGSGSEVDVTLLCQTQCFVLSCC